MHWTPENHDRMSLFRPNRPDSATERFSSFLVIFGLLLRQDWGLGGGWNLFKIKDIFNGNLFGMHHFAEFLQTGRWRWTDLAIVYRFGTARLQALATLGITVRALPERESLWWK